ncbi:MAG: amidohydrolase family protein [Bacteroidetes bacterium]|nr:amidohydrolase family protein [Bacteroidota bacterium]
MNKTILTLLIGFGFSSLSFHAQKEQKSILFINAHLHKGNGEVMQGAAVGIVGSKIELIKSSVSDKQKVEDWDTIIDLKNQHMYPGLVAPNSTLGLTEVDAVRSTRDFDEVGTFNPHIRALIAYNVESEIIATVRSNGVLISQITPRGGVITGTSSVMHLDGWNWEDAAIREDDGVHVNWPDFFRPNRGAVSAADEDKRKESYESKKKEIRRFFTESKAYSESKKITKTDLRYAAMKDCFEGSKRVFFHANELQQLLDIIDFSKEFGLKFPVIIGGYDAYLILPQLRDSKIPVMLPRVHSLPESENDPVDLPYRLPQLLKEGEVKFCLQNEGDMEAMNARNIAFLAGHTTGYGLTEEEALRAITLSSCEILGIDQEYGSIEVGKQATFFVSKGPALDMRTNEVLMGMMDGKWINLNDRQKDLYKKYSNKYENQPKMTKEKK